MSYINRFIERCRRRSALQDRIESYEDLMLESIKIENSRMDMCRDSIKAGSREGFRRFYNQAKSANENTKYFENKIAELQSKRAQIPIF